MTKSEFRDLIASWCLSESEEAERYSQIRSLTDFLESVLYHEYEPAKAGNHGEFGLRLARWIANAETESQQKSLFLILGHLIFFGREQMRAGYLTAFSRHVLHWLLEVEQLHFFGEDTEAKLNAALSKTAFTEITDSFGLGSFIRWNNLDGQNSRYTWEQHLENWKQDSFLRQVMNYDSNNPERKKKYLVLLEDFVGSGSQMEEAVTKACSLTDDLEVLLCPIVICPEGVRLAQTLEGRHKNLTFSSVLELPPKSLISLEPREYEHFEFAEIRAVLNSLHQKVCGTEGSWQQATSEFGYRDTGAFFCKYDNCPDNTLPAIHHKSDLGWRPLFHRTSREPV